MKFQFPSSYTELVAKRGQNSEFYKVSPKDPTQGLDERIKKNKVREFSDAFNVDNTIITENERFDFLYYYITALKNKYDQQAHLQVLDSLQYQLQHLMRQLLEKDDQSHLEQPFLMTLFLSLQTMQLVPKKQQAMEKTPTTTKEKGGSLPNAQKKMVRSILMVVQQQGLVVRLVPHEAIHYFFDLVQLVSEVKENETKEILIQVVIRCIYLFPNDLQYLKTQLSNLIYENEQVTGGISLLLQKDDSVLRSFVNDTILLLVNYITQQKQGSSVESLGTRNLKDILYQTSKMIPKYFYQNLSNFINLYEQDNYYLRNALTDMITHVIEYLIVNQSDIDGDSQMRNKLFEQLLLRVQDKTAYARQAVLNGFSHLLKKNCVPTEYLDQILDLSIGRMKDISGWVRKAALQTLKQLLKFYRQLYVVSQNLERFIGLEEVDRQVLELRGEQEGVERVILSTVDEFQMKVEQQQQIKEEDVQDDLVELRKQNETILKSIELLEQYKRFLHKIQNVPNNIILVQIITPVTILMSSKNQQDVLQSIKLVTYMTRYQLQGYERAQQRLLTLIWAQDKSTREEVLKQFSKLYLSEQRNIQIAQNLIDLYSRAGLKEEASLSQILQQSQSKISIQILNIIWGKFTQEEQLVQLKIAKVFFSQDSSLITAEVVQVLLQLLKKQQSQVQWPIVKEICNTFTMTSELNIVKCIKPTLLLLYQQFGCSDTQWFQACEETLNLISQVNKPEKYYEFFVKKMGEKLIKQDGQQDYQQDDVRLNMSQEGSEDDDGDLKQELSMEVEHNNNNLEYQYSQVIFAIGHIAIKILTIIDQLEYKLKLIRSNLEQKNTTSNKQQQEQDHELDKISGGYEAEFYKSQEQLQDIADKKVVQKNMISLFIPIIMSVIKQVLNRSNSNKRNQHKHVSPILERMSILTFCKVLCVSESFCKDNLQLLFDLLKSDNVDYSIKNNIIISVGDLLHRFPNTVQQYHKQVYANLYDRNPTVKKITLLVLTHLILNDMIKSKISLTHIPRLLNDPDPNIPSMARFFLAELTKKDPRGILNTTPDLLQNLQANYEIIVPQIVSFLDKNHGDLLLDKLIHIMGDLDSSLEVRAFALCISLLNLTLNSFKRILDNWEHIRTKFEDAYVQDQFRLLIRKQKRSQNNPELKQLLDELEAKIDNYKYETFDGKRRIPEKARRRQGKQQQQMELEKPTKKQSDVPKLKKHISKNKKNKLQMDSSSETEGELIDFEEEIPVNKNEVQVQKVLRQRKHIKQQFNDSDED